MHANNTWNIIHHIGLITLGKFLMDHVFKCVSAVEHKAQDEWSNILAFVLS